ncbi:MAG TPA: o-succinylbenzoate synthase [Mycobacteriales bacterium]|nr:o-succinylbenzoate synthase [Mycobacteriales bacterium]HWB67930.1 o-succinylbenzoate synthase [Mycobacteriales bacterium]
MKIESLELLRLAVPLLAPFRTSFGTQTQRDVLLVHVRSADAEGWAECVALSDPLYSSEYVDGVDHVLRHHLVPRLLAASELTAAGVGDVLRPIKGHRMAKAALETAVLDAELRAANTSLASRLGGVRERIPAGVSVGIMDSLAELLDAVRGYLDEGYVRIKLKIEPGWDFEPVKAVREAFGDVTLQTDANAAYTVADWEQLARLDDFDLLFHEQPLDEEDVRGHAELARRLRTPICLDESIVSAASAADAIAIGACSVINIKPGRVGGYLEATRVHDVALSHGVPVWCGGMLETGIGRAANAALASLPGFTLPGDVSASNRYYAADITTPFVLDDGQLTVPTGPGIGVDPLPEMLAELLVDRSELVGRR